MSADSSGQPSAAALPRLHLFDCSRSISGFGGGSCYADMGPSLCPPWQKTPISGHWHLTRARTMLDFKKSLVSHLSGNCCISGFWTAEVSVVLSDLLTRWAWAAGGWAGRNTRFLWAGCQGEKLDVFLYSAVAFSIDRSGRSSCGPATFHCLLVTVIQLTCKERLKDRAVSQNRWHYENPNPMKVTPNSVLTLEGKGAQGTCQSASFVSQWPQVQENTAMIGMQTAAFARPHKTDL